MQTIRLTLNKNLEEVFNELEVRFKPLSRVEIMKVALTNFYQNSANRSLSDIFAEKMEETKWLPSSQLKRDLKEVDLSGDFKEELLAGYEDSDFYQSQKKVDV